MKIAVIGAGLMGRAAVYDLARADGVDEVGVFDIDSKPAGDVADRFGNDKAVFGKLDAGDTDAVAKVLSAYDAVVSCVTYKYNPGLTEAAIAACCHFVDLGGNNDVVREQLGLGDVARNKNVIVVPDCGLAPGMVAVLAADTFDRLDRVESIKIRVGGLPQNPRPPLNYQMVFSAEGLINEYWEPCLILENGRKKIVPPMTAVEELEFEGIGQLEAFYTSGGTSTLPDTYEGRVDFLDYKTIRYPGHCEKFKPMLELGLASRDEIEVAGQNVVPREAFKEVLVRNLTFDDPDLVLVRLSAVGIKDDAKQQIVYELVDRQDEKTGLTAMMRTTSFPAATVAWMAASGEIKERGCKPQELVINPPSFIEQLRRRGLDLRVVTSKL